MALGVSIISNLGSTDGDSYTGSGLGLGVTKPLVLGVRCPSESLIVASLSKANDNIGAGMISATCNGVSGTRIFQVVTSTYDANNSRISLALHLFTESQLPATQGCTIYVKSATSGTQSIANVMFLGKTDQMLASRMNSNWDYMSRDTNPSVTYTPLTALTPRHRSGYLFKYTGWDPNVDISATGAPYINYDPTWTSYAYRLSSDSKRCLNVIGSTYTGPVAASNNYGLSTRNVVRAGTSVIIDVPELGYEYTFNPIAQSI